MDEYIEQKRDKCTFVTRNITQDHHIAVDTESPLDPRNAGAPSHAPQAPANYKS